MLAAHSTVMAVNVLDGRSLIDTFGTLGIAVVLLIETGLLVGLVLPGDSLLFSAGLFCATSNNSTVHLHLGWVLLAAIGGTLIGSQIGYHLGQSAGPRLLAAKDRPRLVAAVERTRTFLENYGIPKAIVLARFVPVVRTLINPLAGIVGVPVRQFTIYQVVGGVAWTLVVTIAGWQLGSHIHNIDHYLLPIVALVVILSLIPVLLEVRKDRRGRTTA
jgi:membrane-associated protein